MTRPATYTLADTIRTAMAAAAAVIALAGCTTPAGPRENSAVTQAQIRTSVYQGRFALQYTDRYNNARNISCNFSWRETGETITVELRSPLGQTLALIRTSPGTATLELPNRQPQSATDVKTLMETTLGFSLPLSGLRYWLKASPAPHTAAQIVDDPQNSTRIKEIRQDGWTIHYIAYADTAHAGSVKRVNLARQEPPISIKLVLDS